MALIKPTGKVMTIARFESGKLITGHCTRFIKSLSYGVILSNGARFGVKDLALFPVPPVSPGARLPHSVFVPPPNVRTIATDKFAKGKGRTMIFHFGSVLLWSGRSGSAIGTLSCAPLETYPCALGDLILSSRYQIREFAIIPPIHAESRAGALWMWMKIGRDKAALVTYDTLTN